MKILEPSESARCPELNLNICVFEGVHPYCDILILPQGHPGKEGPPGEKGAQVRQFICMCVFTLR